MALSTPTWAASAVVDTLSDLLDGDVTSLTTLAATPGPDGKVSLREAITAANNTSGSDEITFSVIGTIEVLSELPALSDASGNVIIHGAGAITLRNNSGLSTVDGLVVASSANDVRGLTIRGFASGIHIKGSAATINIVSACTLGGTREGEGGDFLSLVMFVPEYLERLIELGEKDAAARGGELLDFVDG